MMTRNSSSAAMAALSSLSLRRAVAHGPRPAGAEDWSDATRSTGDAAWSVMAMRGHGTYRAGTTHVSPSWNEDEGATTPGRPSISSYPSRHFTQDCVTIQ